jgi:hypothetical protein
MRNCIITTYYVFLKYHDDYNEHDVPQRFPNSSTVTLHWYERGPKPAKMSHNVTYRLKTVTAEHV